MDNNNITFGETCDTLKSLISYIEDHRIDIHYGMNDFAELGPVVDWMIKKGFIQELDDGSDE